MISATDGPGQPTASLRDILEGSKDISRSARLHPKTQERINLYVNAFGLDVDHLAGEHEFGVDVVRRIRQSETYRGFEDALKGKTFSPHWHDESASMYYFNGYMKAKNV